MARKERIIYMAVLNYLHQFNFASVVFRIVLSMAVCGTIGYGRTKRSKTAGFRTYMLTGIGSAMSIMLALYNYEMMNTLWADTVSSVGMKFDASRFRLPSSAPSGQRSDHRHRSLRLCVHGLCLRRRLL